MIEEILRAHGYLPETTVRPSYRGSSAGPQPITRVTKEGFKGYAADASAAGMLEHLRRIESVQDQIPHVARIHEFVDTIVVIEEGTGTLLWELETAPQHIATIRAAVEETSRALRQIGLVHADVRPWNLVFEETAGKLTLFDWGYSFFTNEPSFGNLDAHLAARGFDRTRGHDITQHDIEACLAILEGSRRPEDIWHHQHWEFWWRPSWCRQPEFPANTLRNDQFLMPGQSIFSPSGRYRLIYQSDGNLVVYDTSQFPAKPIWHAQTHGSVTGRFQMQADGNAVIYSSTGSPIWATWTQDTLSAWLELKDDGALVVNAPSGTAWDFTSSGQLLPRD